MIMKKNSLNYLFIIKHLHFLFAFEMNYHSCIQQQWLFYSTINMKHLLLLLQLFILLALGSYLPNPFPNHIHSFDMDGIGFSKSSKEVLAFNLSMQYAVEGEDSVKEHYHVVPFLHKQQKVDG